MGELTSASHESNLARERGRCQTERAGDGSELPLLRSRGRSMGAGLADATLAGGRGGRGVWEVELAAFCPCWCHLEVVLWVVVGG